MNQSNVHTSMEGTEGIILYSIITPFTGHWLSPSTKTHQFIFHLGPFLLQILTLQNHKHYLMQYYVNVLGWGEKKKSCKQTVLSKMEVLIMHFSSTKYTEWTKKI